MELELRFEVDSNGIAYTYLDDRVKGTLNFSDVQVLARELRSIPDNSVYLETGSYLGCSAILAASMNCCDRVSDWNAL